MNQPVAKVGNAETGDSPFGFEPSRRQLLAFGGLTVGALLLSGCSGSSSSSDPSSTGGKPKKGGTLKIAISDGDASESLDPGLTLGTNAMIYCNAIYDPLVTIDQNKKVVAGLAESWEVSPDAKQVTFHLRKGVKWHDGTDFTSADVVDTVVHRWLDPKTGNAIGSVVAAYVDPSGVSAPDDSTVVFKLKAANSSLVAGIAGHYSNKITKKGTTKFTSKTAIGTGPFKLTEFTPGTRWAAVRNDAYWGGAPYLDGLQATITPDQGAKLQGIIGGSSDVTDTIPISLWTTLSGKSDVKLQTIKGKNNFVIEFDQRNAPYNDQRVIEALKLATDREAILKTAAQGHGQIVADVGVPPDSPYYPSGLKAEYNPAKAKSLLADAGFPNGLDIELSTNPDLPGMIDVAQAWQQSVKAAGINVKLKQFPLSTYWTDGWMATPAFMDYWNYFSPESLFDLFYAKGAVWDVNKFDDPTLDKMVTAIHAEVDEAKRIKLVQTAFLRAREKFGNVIPFYIDAGYAHSTKVQGLDWNFADTLDFRKAWKA
jgi:peptide/nickel transport system substrate-binding protein